MAIKLIVSDIDGTLIQTNGIVNPINIEAINKLKDEKIQFALATGRSYEGAMEAFSQLNIQGNDHRLICLNGMRTYLPDGTLIKEFHTMNYDETIDIMLLGKDFYQGVLYCFDDIIYFQMDQRSFDDFANGLDSNKLHYFQQTSAMVRIDHVQEIEFRFQQNDPLLKMVFIQSEDYLNLVLARIRSRLPSNYDIMLVGQGWAEIMPNYITKGNAVEALALEFDIDMEDVMVFGDAENDISMFKKAGIAIAMENAMDTVKAVAHDITQDNNMGGVGLEIQRYLDKMNHK